MEVADLTWGQHFLNRYGSRTTGFFVIPLNFQDRHPGIGFIGRKPFNGKPVKSGPGFINRKLGFIPNGLFKPITPIGVQNTLSVIIPDLGNGIKSIKPNGFHRIGRCKTVVVFFLGKLQGLLERINRVLVRFFSVIDDVKYPFISFN